MYDLKGNQEEHHHLGGRFCVCNGFTGKPRGRPTFLGVFEKTRLDWMADSTTFAMDKQQWIWLHNGCAAGLPSGSQAQQLVADDKAPRCRHQGVVACAKVRKHMRGCAGQRGAQGALPKGFRISHVFCCARFPR